MSTNLHIRRATKADIMSIITLQENDGFPHPHYVTPDRLLRLFRRGEVYFLAILNGVTVGFASIDYEIRAQIHYLSVHRDYWRKGVGSMLMKTMIDESKSRGYDRISVYVQAESPIEIFLEKKGFVKVGYYKNRYGNGKDVTIWEVDLSQSRSK